MKIWRHVALVDMDHNCMRTGLEVRDCAASSPHVKMNVIQIFLRNIFTIQEIFLTLNYFQLRYIPCKIITVHNNRVLNTNIP